MLTSLIRSLRAKPISDPSELRRFVSGEASYLAQRSTYEFSRNTLAWFGQHYFADQGFIDVFRKCRWESFGLVAIDMTFLAYGRLAAAAGSATGDLSARALALYGAVLREYPAPDHRPDGWTDLETKLAERLAAPDATTDPAKLARPTAKAIFKTLPVYSQNKAGDFDVVLNAVHFGLVAYSDRLGRRVAAAAAARALLDGAPLDRDIVVPVS